MTVSVNGFSQSPLPSVFYKTDDSRSQEETYTSNQETIATTRYRVEWQNHLPFYTADKNISSSSQEQFDKEFSGRDFLLSIAGTFSSGIGDTSENVKSVLADILLKKYGS